MALTTCAVSRYDFHHASVRGVALKSHARLLTSCETGWILLALRGGATTDENEVKFENDTRHSLHDLTAGGVFLASKEDNIPESKGYKRGRDEMTSGANDEYSPEKWDLPEWTKGRETASRNSFSRTDSDSSTAPAPANTQEQKSPRLGGHVFFLA